MVSLKKCIDSKFKNFLFNFSAGNRRNDMNNYKKVQGLMWTGTAISNAEWTGCRLRVIFLTLFILKI